MRHCARLLAWAREHNYDVGVRYWPVARAIRRTDPERRCRVLDVGSGSDGIVPYLPGWSVTCADLRPHSAGRRRPFVGASVANLPFRDRGWDVVTCVDVMEHLPESDRERALAELTRVSRRLLVVAFPSGRGARVADEHLAEAFAETGHSPPGWLQEHLMHTYPEPDLLERLLPELAGGRRFVHEKVFNESLTIQASHRFLATRFTPGYKLWSFACGLALPVLARPLPSRLSYRSISLVKFGEPVDPVIR